MRLIFLVAVLFSQFVNSSIAHGEEFEYDIDLLESWILKKTPRPPQPPRQPSDEELCLEAGFFWSVRLEECFGDEPSLCIAEGGEWDERQNICLKTIEAINCYERGRYWVPERRMCVATLADVCRAEGGVWNELRHQCLRSLDAIECVATGGTWLEDQKLCVFLVPDPDA
jgi:hypothetical protein